MKFRVDGVDHEFDESRLTFAEGRALERVTGHPFTQLADHLISGDLTSLQAFIWVALKRTEPTLRFEDLDDRNVGDFEFETEAEEEGNPPEGAGGSTPDPSTSSDSPASETSPDTSGSGPGSSTTSQSESSSGTASTSTP
jgi:hypothetical protein